MAQPSADVQHTGWYRIQDHFWRLWSGTDGVGRILLVDMAVHGTILNVVGFGASLAVLASDLPTWIAMTVYFAPMPYNLFLFLCVWRAAERRGGVLSWTAKSLAVVWLTAAALF